jgi:hypothetical protein
LADPKEDHNAKQNGQNNSQHSNEDRQQPIEFLCGHIAIPFQMFL